MDSSWLFTVTFMSHSRSRSHSRPRSHSRSNSRSHSCHIHVTFTVTFNIYLSVQREYALSDIMRHTAILIHIHTQLVTNIESLGRNIHRHTCKKHTHTHTHIYIYIYTYIHTQEFGGWDGSWTSVGQQADLKVQDQKLWIKIPKWSVLVFQFCE